MSQDLLRGTYEDSDIRKWSKEELHLALEDALSRLVQARHHEEQAALDRMEGRSRYVALEAKLKKRMKKNPCGCQSCDCAST